jgi:hypothetical protein
MDIKAIVNIESKPGKVPVDGEQRKFLQKEYTPISMFKWGFNGKCGLKSQPTPGDLKLLLREVPFFDL